MSTYVKLQINYDHFYSSKLQVVPWKHVYNVYKWCQIKVFKLSCSQQFCTHCMKTHKNVCVHVRACVCVLSLAKHYDLTFVHNNDAHTRKLLLHAVLPQNQDTLWHNVYKCTQLDPLWTIYSIVHLHTCTYINHWQLYMIIHVSLYNMQTGNPSTVLTCTGDWCYMSMYM